MNKYLFLDIDGVLNTLKNLEKQIEDNNGVPLPNMDEIFCPIGLQNLKRIVDVTECQIVLSSTWRISARGRNKVSDNLRKVGLELHGTTLYLNTERWIEIETYLKRFSHYTGFVILDDEDFDMGKFKDTNLVRIDGEIGITDDDVEKAISILNRGDTDVKS